MSTDQSGGPEDSASANTPIAPRGLFKRAAAKYTSVHAKSVTFLQRKHDESADLLQSAARPTAKVLRILGLVRFSLILGVIGSTIFLFVDQGVEILVALTEDLFTQPLPVIAFVFMATACAGTTWYSARVLLRMRFPHEKAPRADACPSLKIWLPRALGASVLLIAAVAALLCGEVTAERLTLTGLLLAILGLFLLFVTRRRRVLGIENERHVECAGPKKRGFSKMREVPTATKYFGWITCCLFAFSCVFLATAWGQSIAARLESGAVFLWAFALLVPVGSLLVYFGHVHRLPIILLCFLWAIACGVFNDNHDVRLKPEAREVEITEQSTVEEHLKTWATTRGYEGKPFPVFLISAEGGGIRAAYWTALILGELERSTPGFHEHVLSISGVSGGSLGAAVYTALLRAGVEGEDVPSAAKVILAEDFLAPTCASMLFPDLLQRFIPFPLFPDRAIALEQAWERAWGACEACSKPPNRLDGNFLDLYDGEMKLPWLFLNSTVVETGQRLLVHPLACTHDAFARTFAHTIDGYPILSRRIRLSTAAGLSARFTYVSPVGSVRLVERTRTRYKISKDLPDRFRLADGGYFENSGATTTRELLMALRGVRNAGGFEPRPFVIHISNTATTAKAESPLAAGANDANPDKMVMTGRLNILSEVRAPLQAILNARPARGYQSREALARATDKASFTAAELQHIKRHWAHFRIHAVPGTSFPLGWMLSQKAREAMDAQARWQVDDVASAIREHIDGPR